jgi:hypothetical protein
LLALTSVELSTLSSGIAEVCEHVAGGSQEAILTCRRGEFSQAGPEDESALHVSSHESVILQGHGKSVCRRSGQAGCLHEGGEIGRASLEGTQD